MKDPMLLYYHSVSLHLSLHELCRSLLAPLPIGTGGVCFALLVTL